MMRISVIGGGYVGLVAAACFADLGHQVSCIEVDREKAEAIRRNALPIREPRLSELWERYQQAGKLVLTESYATGLKASEMIFITVGTPALADGAPDLRQVTEAARSVVAHVDRGDGPTLVIKSTVPVGTADSVETVLRSLEPETPALSIVSNPEFLREGNAVQDFLQPDRIVIGANDEDAAGRVAQLYAPLRRPFIMCDSRTAELIKYASNAFLATKVSFINEIAEIADNVGVDVTQVAAALGMDPRIGPHYLRAGLGWGGSCLPKDLNGLLQKSASVSVSAPLLRAVARVNRRQPRIITRKLRSALGGLQGATIGLWGLAFKPNCDDVRDSPALDLAGLLLREGCRVQAYDPEALAAGVRALPELTPCTDAYDAATDADAVVLATEWDEFADLKLSRVQQLLKRPILIDARNVLSSTYARAAGLLYVGIGRPAQGGEGTEPSAALAARLSSNRDAATSPEVRFAHRRTAFATVPMLEDRHV